MSMAFEVSSDDVLVVLTNHKDRIAVPFTDMEVFAASCFEELDIASVEGAALSADIDEFDDDATLKNQTDAAYDDILDQLIEHGKISLGD